MATPAILLQNFVAGEAEETAKAGRFTTSPAGAAAGEGDTAGKGEVDTASATGAVATDPAAGKALEGRTAGLGNATGAEEEEEGGRDED